MIDEYKERKKRARQLFSKMYRSNIFYLFDIWRFLLIFIYNLKISKRQKELNRLIF